jgi:hypothetical protein
MDAALGWFSLLEEYCKGSTWSVHVQGKLLQVKHRLNHSRVPCTAVRGTIKGFSRAARLRMLKFVAKVDWQKIPAGLFITLTYPDEQRERDRQRRNTDRYLFHRYVETYLKKEVPCIWRIEWKERLSGINRGKLVPHYHLLLLGASYIHWATIRKWWRTILDCVGPLATDVRKVEQGEMASLYVSKYTAKMPDQPSLDNAAYLNNQGRHYGIHRCKKIPLHDRVSIPRLSPVLIDLCKSIGEGKLPHYDVRYDSSFTLLGNFAREMGDVILKKAVDGLAEITYHPR